MSQAEPSHSIENGRHRIGQNASVMPVASDNMEPTLRRGDFAVVKPTDAFEGDGVYVCTGRADDNVELWRVEKDLVRRACSSAPWLTLSSAADYRIHMPLRQFESIVLGLVLGRVGGMSTMEAIHG